MFRINQKKEREKKNSKIRELYRQADKSVS